jgi:hypothetical protein
MALIINAGSENKGGTFEQAKKNAKAWLKSIHDEGFLEVTMSYIKRHDNGDWVFHFTHSTTKKVATLEIHGFTDEQCKSFIFSPRVYWNGSSTADPQITDWLEDGFKYRIEYYRAT